MRTRRLVVSLLVLASSTQCTLHMRTDQEFWTQLAKDELAEAFQVQWNEGRARNVVLFVGDGMGPNTVTATRVHRGGEGHRLAFERFPHVGLLKTYSANKMVPDSSCTATALFCGVKANQQTIGVDATVQLGDCAASLRSEARLKSLAAIALEAGKSAGLVTTMRVTHATPGPLYAHSADRRWECEDTMPLGCECKDHARQLVEDWPGRDLHVVLGGGRQVLVSNSSGSSADPLDTWSCIRKDGRNLIETYRRDKESRGLKYSIVSNNKELQGFNADETDYLLGIFANGHLKYEHERDKSPEGLPSISDMVEAAIKILKRNKNGFFLMVEGGNIDMAHHRGRAKTAVNEAAAMEAAVRLAATVTDHVDTLVVVTSDHSHTLSINGYPLRGSNIFGIAGKSPHDGVNYTTLSYGTGGRGSFQHYVSEDHNRSRVARRDPSMDDTESFEYEQIAAIRVDENTHGGGDVMVYARGPYAHLFHSVHEQHYVYHVISFAAKMGAHSSVSVTHTSACLLYLVVLSSILGLLPRNTVYPSS